MPLSVIKPLSVASAFFGWFYSQELYVPLYTDFGALWMNFYLDQTTRNPFKTITQSAHLCCLNVNL